MECRDLPTQRQRDICDGSANLPLTGPHGRNAYLASWGMPQIDSPALKPFKFDKPKQVAKSPSPLVGDEMTSLVAEYNLAAKSSCSCKSWEGKMNDWGVSGCREHREEIISHLSEAYHAATWWDTFKAAGSAVYHSLPLTLGGMVDEAIRRAESSCRSTVVAIGR